MTRYILPPILWAVIGLNSLVFATIASHLQGGNEDYRSKVWRVKTTVSWSEAEAKRARALRLRTEGAASGNSL